jgi:PTS system nitrogen regulatory IIA component
MFDTSEKAIERWIRDDGMPHRSIRGQLLFHDSDVLQWAHERGIPIAREPPQSMRPGKPSWTFADALRAGGIHYGVQATDRDSLLRALVERMPIADESDRDLLLDLLIASEKAGSTGVGDGIAIPHVRNPIVLPVDHSTVTLCFLEHPVDFASVDGKPVHTVFAIVSPTIRAHHTILSRLSRLLHHASFHRAIVNRAPSDEILAAARAAENESAGELFDVATENNGADVKSR